MKQPKPFFRKQTRTWYLQLGKRQFNLGADPKQAWAKYHDLMARRGAASSQPVTVAELFELFLDWCSKHRSQGTYENNRRYLRYFVESVGRRFSIAKLKPHHVTDWIDEHPEWSETSQNDAISIVQRPFNWALKQGRIERNPIALIDDKPSRRRREVVYTTQQWDEILNYVRDQAFRDLLTVLWETGCRPQEARALEARHIDLGNAMAVFPPSEAKGKRHERVIFFTDKALEIVRRLCALHPEGPIFRNSRGNPWTKDAIKCRLNRIKQKTGMPVLCAYGVRHSFATEALKNGVDSVTLAALMGHANLAMVARTSQHLARNPQYLKEQARKARGA